VQRVEAGYLCPWHHYLFINLCEKYILDYIKFAGLILPTILYFELTFSDVLYQTEYRYLVFSIFK
jgi:hypothetical protein